MVGRTFGHLLAITRSKSKDLWTCFCHCDDCKVSGTKTILATTEKLTSGAITSCADFEPQPSRDGGYVDGVRHPLLASFNAMWDRVRNPKNRSYKSYKRKGIKVCDEWLSFAQFCEDMGQSKPPGTSIERICNWQWYEPRNCYWATKEEQQHNREERYQSKYHGGLVPV